MFLQESLSSKITTSRADPRLLTRMRKDNTLVGKKVKITQGLYKGEYAIM